MIPRKAVLVGCAITFVVGALFAGLFGHLLYHWHLTGEIPVISMRTGFVLGYTTFQKAPIIFAFQFGREIIFFALGILLLAVAVIVPIYHRKRLVQTGSCNRNR